MNSILLFIFIFFCFTLVILERETKKISLSFLLLIVYSIIIANRSVNTPDTQAYIDFFQSLSADTSDFSTSGFEYGYQILSKAIKICIGNNARFYLGIIAFINLFLILLSIKKLDRVLSHSYIQTESSLVLALTIYISYFGIFYSGIVLRGGIALAILIYATVVCYERSGFIFKFIKVILLFLLALFFHRTSIIGLFVFLIFLFSKKFSKRQYTICLLVLLILSFFDIRTLLGNKILAFNIFDEILYVDGIAKINSYLTRATVENSLSLKYMYFIVLGFFYVYRLTENILYCKYLNVYIVGLTIYVLFGGIDFLGRGMDYFLIYSFILSYLSLKNIKSYFLFYLSFIIIFSCQLILVARIINGTL